MSLSFWLGGVSLVAIKCGEPRVRSRGDWVDEFCDFLEFFFASIDFMVVEKSD